MSLPKALEAELLALFPQAQYQPDPIAYAVGALLDAERGRRGGLETRSGAHHRLGLLSGALLKEEYDLSTHGHLESWRCGVVLVDPRELLLVNMHHGFPAGDAVLSSLVKVLQQGWPKAKVVRLHADGFGLVCGPVSELVVTEALACEVQATLKAKVLKPDGTPLEWTVGTLVLEVKDPPSHEVLGTVLASECDRALVKARREVGTALQSRTVALDGRLTLAEMA